VRRRRARRIGVLLTCVTVFALLAPASGAVAGPKPVNPSNQQLAAAQAAKQQAAAALGQVSGQLALLQGQLDRAADATDAAIATYNATNTALQHAAADVSTANHAVITAKTTVADARQQIRQYLRSAYIYGRRSSITTLLTSKDPNAGLEALDYQRYLATAQQQGLSTAETNTVALSNAEATQRGAFERAQLLQKQAETQKAQALAQLTLYRQQQQRLNQLRTALNRQATAAAVRLAGLSDQRQAYQRWLAEQRVLQVAEQAWQAAIARQQQQQQQQQQPAPAPSAPSMPTPPPTAAPPGNDQRWALPLPAGSFYMSTCFCMRWGEFHTGDDLAAAYGTPIHAIGGGTVIAAGPAQGFGNWVVIDHGNGFFSIYGHMRVLTVSPGQSVHAGQTVAYVGSEGFSTGPHLHLEIRLGGMSGTPVDPQVFLARRGISI
jgi:murein DD-endopeptidase MepM/ murein hydrolase activator NlpD